ncbi:hypothetical protein [Streptomyces sp. NPDC052042]|uniref:hypothetical protein n=1 Tax=Streptomyces sp. NPDC052042 TaxID=3365683 RepID=UPI0037D5B85D
MDGIPDTSAAGRRHPNTTAGSMRPFPAALMLLVLALLSAALSTLVMLPAAQHLRSFQTGEQASATLHTQGSCILGHCQVEFEADGRTVVADLPVGSRGFTNSVGTRMAVRYHADDPQVAVREDDAGGGGAAVLAVLSGVAALFFLLLSVLQLVYGSQQRRAGPLPGRTPQGTGPTGPTNP